jgi:hypothetical protein
MSPSPAKPAPVRVELTVRTTSGHFQHEFNLHEKVEHLLDRAIKHFHLATGPGIDYVVKRQRGEIVMNPSERLTEYDLVDGDTILIQTSQAQDG